MKNKKSNFQSAFFPEPAFEQALSADQNAPLAVRMRPKDLNDVMGQAHILGEGKLLRRTIQSDHATSMIFYGPPGSGKTTLAQIISRVTQAHFVPLNAVASNVAELRKVIEDARHRKTHQGARTILFVDEIHRFNKSQQDVLMPDVESGTLILIGATTQNPSFAINGPLLSRSTIFELKPLEETDLIALLERALKDPERGLGKLKIEMTPEALKYIAAQSSGDARKALTALEIGALTTPPDSKGIVRYTIDVAAESCQRRIVYYDDDADYHYDTASAFIKSMRGSDPHASIYWLAKMLYAGEDPRFIVRRILILTSEDIGNADPQALILAAAGLQAIEFVGMPEAQIILAQLVTYMALAPKSNASYMAIAKATEDVKNQKSEEVPNHLRDAHYPGAKRLGHGEGYQYSHNVPKDKSLPPQKYVSKDVNYYFPKDSGFEKILKQRLLDSSKQI